MRLARNSQNYLVRMIRSVKARRPGLCLDTAGHIAAVDTVAAIARATDLPGAETRSATRCRPAQELAAEPTNECHQTCLRYADFASLG